MNMVVTYQPEGFINFPNNIEIVHLCRFSPGYNININGSHPRAVMPEDLAQKTFHSVTNDRTSNFLAGSNTKSSRLEVVIAPYNKKTAYSSFVLRGSELKKFSSLPQTCSFWKICRSINGHARKLLFCSNSYR